MLELFEVNKVSKTKILQAIHFAEPIAVKSVSVELMINPTSETVVEEFTFQIPETFGLMSPFASGCGASLKRFEIRLNRNTKLNNGSESVILGQMDRDYLDIYVNLDVSCMPCRDGASREVSVHGWCDMRICEIHVNLSKVAIGPVVEPQPEAPKESDKFIAILKSCVPNEKDEAFFKVKLTPQSDYPLDPEGWSAFNPHTDPTNSYQYGYSAVHVCVENSQIKYDELDCAFYYCQPIELVRADTVRELIHILSEGPYKTARLDPIMKKQLMIMRECDYIASLKS